MKKVLLITILIIAGCCTNAQDSLTHKSVIVYGFRKFSIILVSQSTTDLLLSQPGIQEQSSAKERIVSVHGEMFGIFITTNKEPFLYPVKKVSFDTNVVDTQTAAIDNLEMRAGAPDVGEYTKWLNVKSFPLLNKDSSISLYPLIPGNLPVTKGDYYILLLRAVRSYLKRVVSIRNKMTKEEILNISFSVVESPIRPFLVLEIRDNAGRKLIDSLLKRNSRMMEIPDLHEILNQKGSNTSSKVSDTSKLLRNENLHETSELALYFKKERHNYPDSSMEFRLFSETNKNTNWIKTGHRLIISNLVAGNHYKLQIRYELHPAFIQEHTFYVAPKWYQTTQSKIFLAGLLVLITLVAWLLIYNGRLKKSKRRREQLSLEIKSIRSQLNPHFIFNALSSIQSLINKNDIPAANRYLTEFSTLLRESLHNHDQEMAPLVTEINLLDIYLKLEQLRFNFKYEIRVDEAINKNATEIPNLLLQPLVENAVKHGVSTLSEKGLIKIEFVKRDHNLFVLITDNGNKFDETNSHDGFGLKLTRNRISLLNQTVREQPIKLSIERRQDMETIVNLVFTNWV